MIIHKKAKKNKKASFFFIQIKMSIQCSNFKSSLPFHIHNYTNILFHTILPVSKMVNNQR